MQILCRENTRYFHNLEKRHFNSKTIRYLQSANGKKFSTDVEILDEAKNYYEHLYTTTSVDVSDYDNLFFPEVTETKLGNNQKESCEGLLSATECLQSLKTMESGKSPGTDSFPAEFYKVFLGRFVSLFTRRFKLVFYPGTPFHLAAQGVDNPDTKERQTATASKKLETYKPFKLRLQNCNKSNCSKNKKSVTWFDKQWSNGLPQR